MSKVIVTFKTPVNLMGTKLFQLLAASSEQTAFGLKLIVEEDRNFFLPWWQVSLITSISDKEYEEILKAFNQENPENPSNPKRAFTILKGGKKDKGGKGDE